jgi:hypothetical protein
MLSYVLLLSRFPAPVDEEDHQVSWATSFLGCVRLKNSAGCWNKGGQEEGSGKDRRLRGGGFMLVGLNVEERHVV